MSYDTQEISQYGGNDVRLYEFQIGTRFWRYCNADRDTTFNTAVYTAIAITDNGLKQKGTASTDDFVVEMPTVMQLPQLFLGTPPSAPIKFTLRAQHFDQPADAPIMWRGYVASAKIKDEVASQIICNTNTAFLHRSGMRSTYTRECNHALYDSECRVDKTVWAEIVTITGLSGNSMAFTFVNTPLSADRAGRFRNGFIEWLPNLGADPGGWVERRAILEHEGHSIQLFGQTDGLSVGMQITLYPGCDRSPGNCQLFSNISNYGGFAFMTGESPFDGNPVW